MTDLALRAPGPPTVAWSALTGTAQAMLATYRLGGRTLVAAPLLVAIAVLPELAQHIAEISLGMFESAAAFQAHALDPFRWTFAYPKVVGFALAILAITRFWALGSVRAALTLRPANLVRILIAVALTWAFELPFDWLMSLGLLPDSVVTALALLAQAGFLVFLLAALVEDRSIGLRRAFTDRWPTALLLGLLGAVAFMPAASLHSFHHLAAMGQPEPIIWALMLWDSLWVGLMAALLGSAAFVAQRTGLSWRGWTVHPRDIG